MRRSPPHPWTLIHVDDVPEGSQWLGPLERETEVGLHRKHRRQSWRAGRFAAKRLLAERGDSEHWQVLAASDGCPEAFRPGSSTPLHLGITHRGPWAAAAISVDGGEIGVDLEAIEPRSELFVKDFFTSTEAALDRAARAAGMGELCDALIWSAKESALKCARTGLRRDTRTVEITVERMLTPPQPGRWAELRVHDRERSLELEGWWQHQHGYVLTMVAPAPHPVEAEPPVVSTAPPWRPAEPLPALRAASRTGLRVEPVDIQTG